MCGQPNASTQYKDWKEFPKTYAEPKHEDWLAEISAQRDEKNRVITKLQTEIAEKDEDYKYLKQLFDGENKAHNEWMNKCAALQARIKELEAKQKEGSVEDLVRNLSLLGIVQ